MAEALNVEPFLALPGPLYDVRSPKEFLHATLPSAMSLPLFSDEERAEVGTLYKQKGQESAIVLGLKIVGPKMSYFSETALSRKSEGPPRVFCWRGGMRSRSMAWLFDTLGLKPITLKGGYKAFRRWSLQKLTETYTFITIGGYTGSRKTDILKMLQKQGEQILDLEALAHHRGSAFGTLGQDNQPSNEDFENKIAVNLHHLRKDRPIFVEDESRMIGICKIPNPIYDQIKKAKVIFIDVPLEERISHLIAQYGTYPKEKLIESASRLNKKLGGKRCDEICALIENQDLNNATRHLLDYYDSAYHYSLERRSNQGLTPLLLHEKGLSLEDWSKKIQQVVRGI